MERFGRGRTWLPWALAGSGILAVLVIVVIVVADSGTDFDIPPKQPGEPLVTWGEPEGEPQGVVMLLHGGGWKENVNGYAQQVRTGITLQELGYATVAVGYDSGVLGFRQIQDIYGKARERYPNVPICAAGQSAGGHWALMLATREPDLACAIDFVGPTDLLSLKKRNSDDGEGLATALEVFGEEDLAKYSPVRFADQIRAKVLIVLAESDPVVPYEQGVEFKRALPSTELFIVPPGPVKVPWAHFGGVPEGADQEVLDRQLDFLERATQGA